MEDRQYACGCGQSYTSLVELVRHAYHTMSPTRDIELKYGKDAADAAFAELQREWAAKEKRDGS